MKKSFEGILSNQSIDAIGDLIRSGMDEKNIASDQKIGVSFSLENILQFYQEKLGEDAKVRVTLSDSFSRFRTVVRIFGAPADLSNEESEEEYFYQKTLERLNLKPTWSYRHGWNTISFQSPVKKKISSFALLAAALLLGIVLGLFAKNFFPSQVLSLSERWLAPLSSTIMGLLSTLSTLMMSFSIISGIYSMGDISTFQKIGKNLILHFVLSITAGGIGSFLLCLLFYPLDAGSGSAWEAESLWDMLLGIIPTNLFEAFYTQNTLQLMFLALFFGITLLVLSSGVRAVSDFFVQMDLVIQTMVQTVLNFLPIPVFCSLFNLMISDHSADYLISYRYPLFVFICCLAALIYYVLKASVRLHISPVILIKKTIPSSLIAFSTGSSTSTFSTNMDICEHELGIENQFVKIGIPLEQMLFGMTRITSFICAAFIVSGIYGSSISVSQVIPFLFTSVIYTLAAPPISGSTLSCFLLLFNQLGIPAEGLAIVIAFQPITDRIITSMKAVASQCDLAYYAAKYGYMKEGPLKK